MNGSNPFSIPISIYNTPCRTYEELPTVLSEHAVDGDKPSMTEIFHQCSQKWSGRLLVSVGLSDESSRLRSD
jgi:hypothetical protein